MKKRLLKTICLSTAAVLAAGVVCGCAGKAPDANETAIVVNGEEFPFGEVNFYIRYQQAQTYYYMTNFGLSGQSFWDSDYTYNVDENGDVITDTDSSSSSSSSSSTSSESEKSEGKEVTSTYGEYSKKVAIGDFKEMAVIRQKAISDYNYEISEEQQTSIKEAAQKFMEANSNASEIYGVTQEMIEDLLEMYTYKADLKALATEDIDREVSDEEAAQSTVMYIRLATEERAQTSNSVSGSTNSSSSEEEIKTDEERLAEANEVLEQFKANPDITSDEANTMADAVDEDFFAMEYSYGKDDDILPSEVTEAAATLSDGEVYDGVIETDSFFYIVKLVSEFDEEATQTEKESIISERETQAYNDIIKQWVLESDISEKSCLNSITVTDKAVYTAASTTTSDESSTSSSSSSSSDSSSSSTSSSTSSSSVSTVSGS